MRLKFLRPQLPTAGSLWPPYGTVLTGGLRDDLSLIQHSFQVIVPRNLPHLIAADMSPFIIIIINPLTARVVGAPQMILQPVFSVFLCSPLPSGACRTQGLSIPWCCLPISSSVCLTLELKGKLLSSYKFYGVRFLQAIFEYQCSVIMSTVIILSHAYSTSPPTACRFYDVLTANV